MPNIVSLEDIIVTQCALTHMDSNTPDEADIQTLPDLLRDKILTKVEQLSAIQEIHITRFKEVVETVQDLIAKICGITIPESTLLIKRLSEPGDAVAMEFITMLNGSKHYTDEYRALAVYVLELSKLADGNVSYVAKYLEDNNAAKGSDNWQDYMSKRCQNLASAEISVL